MAYSSGNNRPMEWASKSSHTHLINDENVKGFLSRCVLPKNQDEIEADDLKYVYDINHVRSPLKHVIAIDGGYTESLVRKKYPSSSIAFFQFGALFFDLQDLHNIENSPFIAPEDMAKFKELERIKLVLPIKNITFGKEVRLTDSVRRVIHDFFLQDRNGRNYYDTLKWLLYEEYLSTSVGENYKLASCPLCKAEEINVFRKDISIEYTFHCDACKQEIFLIDIFRLHEAIDDELGAGGILGYVCTTLEQIILAHYIRFILEKQPSLLKEVLFVKDGPLAFFGQTANMHKIFRKLCKYLLANNNLCLAGIEKSGAFVEHAREITNDQPDGRGTLLPKGKAFLLNNDYIYKYVIPQNGKANPIYASTSYYGGKLIYKSHNDRVYVVTIPVNNSKVVVDPTIDKFQNLEIILNALDELKCDMYNNSLVPIALVNHLVSLANHPSSVILEKFATNKINSN